MTDQVENNLDNLTQNILDSYDQHHDIQRVDEAFLPSRGKIVEIIETLRQLIFPGFFGHKELTHQNIRYHVGNQIARISRELTDQICHCLCYVTPCENAPHCQKQCTHVTKDFLQSIPNIRQALTLDAQAAYDGDPAAKNIAEIVYSYPGFYAITIYRMAHQLHKLSVPLMPRIMTEYAHSITGTDIHPAADIGESFFIDHATGVVIGETTIIGNHVKIYQGVTLGAHSFPKDERGRAIKGLKRHPTIEDHVTIYANATILGGKTIIGKGTTIGGNAFVAQSIPPNHIVQLEPPRQQVIQKIPHTDRLAHKGE